MPTVNHAASPRLLAKCLHYVRAFHLVYILKVSACWCRCLMRNANFLILFPSYSTLFSRFSSLAATPAGNFSMELKIVFKKPYRSRLMLKLSAATTTAGLEATTRLREETNITEASRDTREAQIEAASSSGLERDDERSRRNQEGKEAATRGV